MAPSKPSSNRKKVTKKPNNVTKQQRSAPRKRGKTERKQIQDAVNNWHSQYKNQINPSTGVNWTLTEFVESPGALGVKYGTLYDYCRKNKAKDVPSEQQNVMIPKGQLKTFISSRLQHTNNSRSQVISSLRHEFQLNYRQACNQYENNVKDRLNSLLASRPTTRRTTFDELEYSSQYHRPVLSQVFTNEDRYLYIQFPDNSIAQDEVYNPEIMRETHGRPNTEGRQGCPLNPYQPQSLKKKNNTILGATAYVALHVNIALGTMLYVCNNLHRLMHGDNKYSSKASDDNSLRTSGAQVVDISQSDSTLDRPDIGFHLWRDGHIPGNLGSVNDVMQLMLFSYFWKIAMENAPKTDEERDQNSTTFRWDQGFTQGQSNSDRYVDANDVKHNHLKIPYCHFGLIQDMPPQVRAIFYTILSSCAQTIRSKYPNAFNNQARTKMVHERFISKCWDDLQPGDIPWEYINISIRKDDAELLKHLDGKNDWRLNYHHSAVYSFFVDHEGSRYRFTIVMTTRNTLGRLFDNIAELP